MAEMHRGICNSLIILWNGLYACRPGHYRQIVGRESVGSHSKRFGLKWIGFDADFSGNFRTPAQVIRKWISL
jgi:hypothetical protein